MRVYCRPFWAKSCRNSEHVKFGVVQYILGPLSHVVSVLLGEGGRPLRKLSKVQKLSKLLVVVRRFFVPQIKLKFDVKNKSQFNSSVSNFISIGEGMGIWKLKNSEYCHVCSFPPRRSNTM